MGSGYNNAESSAEKLLGTKFSDHQVFFEKELTDTAKVSERTKAFADTLIQAFNDKHAKKDEEAPEKKEDDAAPSETN